MTKIAIFGDSFAASPHLETSETFVDFIKTICTICHRRYDKDEVTFLRNKWGEKYKSWTRYLDSTVYAYSGSDLYYSYNQFINNHKKYEKCIFVITSPLRYSTNINGWMHCASYDDVIEKSKLVSNSEQRQAFKTMSNFFKDVYYKDIDRIKLLNKAILDSVQKTRPDTLFINAFPDLKRVCDLELEAWNTSYDESQDYTKYFDLRHSHMTNDNNKILADFIMSNLDKRHLDLSTVDWKKPTLEEKGQYLVSAGNLFDFLRTI